MMFTPIFTTQYLLCWMLNLNNNNYHRNRVTGIRFAAWCALSLLYRFSQTAPMLVHVKFMCHVSRSCASRRRLLCGLSRKSTLSCSPKACKKKILREKDEITTGEEDSNTIRSWIIYLSNYSRLKNSWAIM